MALMNGDSHIGFSISVVDVQPALDCGKRRRKKLSSCLCEALTID